MAGAAAVEQRPVAMITSVVWDALEPAERERLKLQYDAQLLGSGAYGSIMDAQGIDQSTPGTTVGAHIGGAVAGAAYLDHGLRGGNYSAGGALAVTLLGAIIGSAMDRQAQSRYQFRYTVRLGDGELLYLDAVSTTAFRHSPGVCVRVPDMVQLSQQVCNQTVESVRKRFLEGAWTPPAAVVVPAPVPVALESPVAPPAAAGLQAPAGPSSKPAL